MQSARAVEYTDCISTEGNTQPRMSVLHMTLKYLIVISSNAGALGNAEFHFIAIAPRSTVPKNVSIW